MKIFIRADGGRDIGLGHIMRCNSLAMELRKSNEVIFICKISQDNKYSTGINILKDNEFKVIEINEDNYLKEIVDIQKEYKYDMLLTDSYDVDEKYFSIVKKYFTVSGYVDDVNKCKMDVHFIINQNINALDLNYKETTQKDTKLFLGTKYCMIREEFRKVHSEKIIKNYVSNILLTVGGMDKDFNTIKILENIKNIDKNIHVVLGSAFTKELIEKVNKLANDNKNIYTYRSANMAELMKKCDIAISACGSTLYELCAMRVPAIGIIIADNQENIAYDMKQKGIISDVFRVENLTSDRLNHSLEKLINNKIIRNEIIEKQKDLVSVYGVINLVNEIRKLQYYER